jgi:hypothetical protein
MADKRKTGPEPPEEPDQQDTNLGYGQGAGHPAGEQDLDKKTENEPD